MPSEANKYVNSLRDAQPGVSQKRLEDFEDVAGSELPPALRTIYEASDGERRTGRRAVRLLSLMEIESIVNRVRTREWWLQHDWVSFGIVPFWDLNDSDFAGVFLRGAGRGAVCVLDHEEIDFTPQFRSLSSFLSHAQQLNDSQTEDFSWPHHPEQNRSATDLAFDKALAREFEIASEAANDEDHRSMLKRCSIALTPPGEIDTIEQLRSPDMYVQERAAKILGERKEAAAIEPLYELAIQFGGNGSMAAITALAQIGNADAIDALYRIIPVVPKGWVSRLGHALRNVGCAEADFRNGRDWHYRDRASGEWIRLRYERH